MRDDSFNLGSQRPSVLKKKLVAVFTGPNLIFSIFTGPVVDGQPGGLARQLHHVLPAHRGAGHVPAVALVRHLPAAPRQHQVGVRVRHRQGAAVRGGGVLGRVPVRLRVRRGEGGSAAAAQAARFGPAADD